MPFSESIASKTFYLAPYFKNHSILFPFFSNGAFGDAIVVTRAMHADTIAELFVDERSVRIELEVGVADFGSFHNILPDNLFERMTGTAVPLAERSEVFLENGWVLSAHTDKLKNFKPMRTGFLKTLKDAWLE